VIQTVAAASLLKAATRKLALSDLAEKPAACGCAAA
jgi:hypothetical protein